MIPMSTEFDHFCKWADAALAKHQVHSAVQNRLAQLLVHEFPDNPSVAEVFAVKGGRNDLIHYDQQGRLAVFELFCSTSQVPQDLRLLEQADAHWKIAVLLDREIRPELSDAYFHKKPQTFPFLWLSQVMMPGKEADCREKLRCLLTTEPIHTPSASAVVQTVSGNDNIVANAPQGDININQKKVVRPKVVREFGDISEATAFAIQDLIRQLAQTDEMAGKPSSYGEWQQRLKTRYKVASYRKLTVDQGASAIRWLKQELGRKLPSLRRNNNDEWRQRIYKGIWAAARELGFDKPQVYEFAVHQLELKNPISSLKELGEQKLETLRDKLRYRARKQR
jgi:hypothetical protein